MNKVTQSIYKKKVDDLEEDSGGGKLYRHQINLSNRYYFELYSSDNSPLTFTTLGMNHTGYYTLIYPNCDDLTNDFRLNTCIKVVSAVTIELYGFKVVKSTLATTAQLTSTINTGGSTITDTVTEV